jgi:hypothetical protein
MTNPLDLNPQMVAEFGQGGVVCTSNTSAVTGRFYFIKVVTDTVFQSISENGRTGSRVLSRNAGDTLYGDFTGYQLVSGDVEAYPK